MLNIKLVIPGSGSIPELKNALKKAAEGRGILLPSISSMDAFIDRHARISRAAPEKCLLTLFFAFRKIHHSDENLASFLSLGQTLLADFDLILMAGQSPAEAFGGMKKWESTGAGFADFMSDEQKELMKNFSGLFREDASGKRMRFLRLWENLPAIFQELENSLLMENLGTAGMVYRNARQNLLSLSAKTSSRFYFAGFSSLSGLENNLLCQLADKGLADFAWDLMPEFHTVESHEVKRIFRKLQARPQFQKSLEKWMELTRTNNSTLQLRQISCPGISGMAQWIAAKKQPDTADQIFILSNPALIPLLANTSVPFHFSMGYPLAYTPPGRWMYKLLSWLARKDEKNCSDFLPLLQDRHFQYFFPEAFRSAENTFHESSKTELKAIKEIPGLPGWFFTRSAAEFLQDFSTWLNSMKPDAGSDDMYVASMPLMREIFDQLRSNILHSGSDLSFSVLQTLVNGRLQSAALSWKPDEPHFKAMGLYESRLSDFRKIVIAPGDDGLFPTHAAVQTMLPETVRKAFSLPLKQDRSDEQAWQFYRLCKRSEEIVFLVSSAPESRRSRFLEQIELEGLFRFDKEELLFGNAMHPAPAIRLARDSVQMNEVRKYISVPGKENPERKFSPTSLHALITCPLRFHYQKTMRLKEPETYTQNEMAVLDYGNWIHSGIQQLLKKYGESGQYLLPVHYTSMENEWDEAAPQIWTEMENKTSLGALEDFPIEQALGRIMAMRFFSFMKKHRPHRWLANEYDFPDLVISDSEKQWLLSGRADIILEEDACFRFVDLKTGSFQLKDKLKAKMTADGIPDLAKMQDQKEYFQMLAYNRLAAADPKFRGKKVLSSLFYLANPKPELASPLEKLVEEGTDKDFFAGFDAILKEHLLKFSDPDTVINQTADARHCSYCAFNAICRRN